MNRKSFVIVVRAMAVSEVRNSNKSGLDVNVISFYMQLQFFNKIYC